MLSVARIDVWASVPKSDDAVAVPLVFVFSRALNLGILLMLHHDISSRCLASSYSVLHNICPRSRCVCVCVCVDIYSCSICSSAGPDLRRSVPAAIHPIPCPVQCIRCLHVHL
jgi:hypothetical protein